MDTETNNNPGANQTTDRFSIDRSIFGGSPLTRAIVAGAEHIVCDVACAFCSLAARRTS